MNNNHHTDDIGALIDEAAEREGQGRPERIVYVPLRAYLQADIDELRQQLTDIERGAAPDAMEVDPQAAELRARIEDLTGRLRDSVRPFRLRAMPRPAFRALVDEHPPRRVTDEDSGVERVHPRDRGSEFNIDTFYEPLIRACTTTPELSDAQWRKLFDGLLTDHYFTRLGLAALYLNRMQVDVPFSPPASPSSPSSDGGSKQPAGSRSPSNGSTGGNRAARRASGTTKKGGSSRR